MLGKATNVIDFSCEGANYYLEQSAPLYGVWQIEVDGTVIISNVNSWELMSFLQNNPQYNLSHQVYVNGSSGAPNPTYYAITKNLNVYEHRKVRFINQNTFSPAIDFYANPTVFQDTNGNVSFCLKQRLIDMGSDSENWDVKYIANYEVFRIATGNTIPINFRNIETNVTIATALILRDTVQHIGDYAFQELSFIKENIVIPDSVLTIGSYAFKKCNTKSFIIGQSIQNIGIDAFVENVNAETIIIKALQPPVLENDCFKYSDNIRFYVPAQSLNAYKTAAFWSEYIDRIFAIED